MSRSEALVLERLGAYFANHEQRHGVFTMTWNADLDTMTQAVLEQFGEPVFSGAVARAFAKANRQPTPLPPDSALAPLLPLKALANTSSLDSFYDALAVELRRLLTPH